MSTRILGLLAPLALTLLACGPKPDPESPGAPEMETPAEPAGPRPPEAPSLGPGEAPISPGAPESPKNKQ